MVSTRIIATPKQNSTVVNSGGTSRTSTTIAELEQHYLWGQPFNGTQDLTGSMEVQGNITLNNLIASDTVSAPTVNTDMLTATNAVIQTQDSSTITTEFLTVTKQAHFFELTHFPDRSAIFGE